MSFSTRLAYVLHGPAPVVVLVACHVLLGVTAVAKSATFDEGIHVTGGLSYWMTNDYRLHPENGNWTQRLAACRSGWAGFVSLSGRGRMARSRRAGHRSAVFL